METPVPGNLVKTGYQKLDTGTRVLGFWIFQTGTRSPIFRYPGFPVPVPVPVSQ